LTNFAPSSLPAVDAVEVVNLRGVDPNRVDEFMAAAKDAKYVRLVGDKAQRIAAAWRNLPEGEQARCHIPPFGLRFYAGRELILEASICWQCNNIAGKAGAEGVFFEFDGEHAQSRELLAMLKQAMGESAGE
jgi:hypothetical protein